MIHFFILPFQPAGTLVRGASAKYRLKADISTAVSLYESELRGNRFLHDLKYALSKSGTYAVDMRKKKKIPRRRSDVRPLPLPRRDETDRGVATLTTLSLILLCEWFMGYPVFALRAFV